MSAASGPSPRAAPPSSSPPQDAAIPAPHASDRAPPAPAAESDGDPARRPTFDGAEDGIGGGGARGRRSAWNISSNGLSEVGAVMGAVSWPALSESARASPKLSSSDPLKSLPDGSISAPPGPAITPPPPKQNMSNPNPSSTPTPASTSRQKQNPNHSNPIGRGGGGGGGGNLANGGSPPPPPLPPPSHPQPTMEETSQQSTRNFRNRSNNSSDHGPRGGGGSAIYPHGGADNHHSRGNRRGHNGGGGGFGNRRNYGYRDAQQMPPSQLQHGPPPPFLRPPPPPPPPPPPFMGFPPQVRPFISPMGFHEIHSPMYYIPPYPPFESYKNIGYVAHQVPPVMGPTMVVTPEDHQHALMKQIEYYFSSENLCRDLYLRQKMDDHGWVPISLIANFNRVKQLATNLSYILDTVRGSDMLEVEGEKIRRRNDWMNWILPPSSNPYGSTSGSQSPTPSNYDLAGHLQSVGLEEGARNTNSSTNQVLTGVSSRGSTRRNINSGPNVGESN